MRMQAPEPAAVEPEAPLVVEALESTRRAMRRCRLSSALVGVALGQVGLASVIAVADVSWVLPYWVRALGLMALVVGGLAAAVRAALARSYRYRRGDAAAEVEATFPELGQRVRTTLEYAEPTPDTAPASPGLVRALARDTDRQALALEFPAVVPWGAFGRRAFGLWVAILGVLAALAYEPTLRIAAARLLLRPAHYTSLAVEPGDQTVKLGADFTLRATLSGRPVHDARWQRRPAGGREPWSVAPLAPPGNPGERPGPLIGTLEAVQKDCRADFEYRVVAGEVESALYRVTVIRPLVQKSFEAAIEPPAYTRRPPSVTKEGDFRVPEGSKVRLRVELDRAPRSARIAWSPASVDASRPPRSIPIAVEGNRLSAELPTLTGDIHYEIVAEAADGMKLEPAHHRIRVQPDEKPTVRFVKPAESYAATPITEVPFQVEAVDDYGVARVGIAFQVGDGPEQSLYLDDPKGQPATVEALATLYLEKYRPSFTDGLSYHAFAEDNRAPTPQRTRSELRYVDIVPFKREFKLVQGGGTCNGSSVTLEELIARQRQALNRTFAHAEERPVDPKVADRLSRAEAELALATGEFARGLASQFGPVNPLDEAARQMESATVALDAKDLAAALPREQGALAALIQARQNLRKLLSDRASAGQCRKFDQQQQQKIRKPPVKDRAKEGELARLEQDVKKLADDQKKFAEEIDPKGGGGPELEKKDDPRSGPKPNASGRQQAAAAKEADRLKALARQDQALSDLARSRMDEAARQVKAADRDLRADRPGEAAEAARAAAEQLDRLSEQLAGLKAGELAARIAKARDLAQSTAIAERKLAADEGKEPGAAVAAQLGLAEDARTLADLLDRARADAVEEDRALARAIDRAAGANAPVEIERAMRQAAAGLAPGVGRPSAQPLNEAAGRLEALARDLEAARRDLAQPKLEQLLAAERKAAEVREALESADDDARKAEAEKGMTDLARALESLKPAEGPLAAAAEALARATQAGAGVGGWSAPRRIGPRAGLFTPPVSYTNAVRDASRALQARIQQMILDDALVARDGAVPPGYKEMVEDYFRVLSEDLR